jgi:hypothetical protein
MDKVMCLFCKFEIDKRCNKKNSKVNLKKKRICKLYEDDDDKLREMAQRKLNSKKPQVTFRPDWYWDRKNFIKKLKKEEAERAAQQPSVFTGNPEHPLTGDLSRFFKSTVEEKNE